MKRNKYIIKKWVLVPIFLLLCSLVLGLNYLKPVNAYTAGITPSDENLNYLSFAPDNIKMFMPDFLTNSLEYVYFDLPQLKSIDLDGDFNPNPVYKGDVDGYVSLENIVGRSYAIINGVEFNYLSQIYNYISTPFTFSEVPVYFDIYWENLVIPTEFGLNANMAYTYDDFLSDTALRWSLITNRGNFTYFTCKVAYWSYNNEGYAFVDYLDLEYNLSDLNIVVDFEGADVLPLFNLCRFIENDLISDYNLGQYFMYISDLHIYASNDYFLTEDYTFALSWNAPFIVENDIPFYDTSDNTAYHSYYYSIQDYFSNPNIPPLAYTPIEPIDMSSWLLTSVGAFMTAELFPGFAVAGILAVVVAFPLAIWLLKVALGG